MISLVTFIQKYIQSLKEEDDDDNGDDLCPWKALKPFIAYSGLSQKVNPFFNILGISSIWLISWKM